MKFFLYILLYLCLCTKTFAQVFYNESYHYQFLTNYELVNPSYSSVKENGRANVLTTYASFFGPQKVFKTVQAYGITQLKNDKIALGGRIFSNISEQYSSLSFVNFLFQYVIVKTKKLEINTGTWVGANNYLLQANAFYGGSSEWNFDWRFGGFVRYHQLKMGLSLHHFLPSVFTPIQQEIRLTREINAYSSYLFNLSLYSQIEPVLLYSIRNEINNNWYWGVKYIYEKKYKLNIGLRNMTLTQFGVSAYFNKIEFGLNFHRFFDQIQQNGYQIQIHYFFN